MRARRDQPEDGVGRDSPQAPLPPGTPEWITPDLVERTIRVWQPFYGKAQLSPADAVQILVGTGRLLAVLDGR
ncbi:MAG: hypothetical protein KF705_00220 [Phycisphaeraceae bacterium]|nr:hypothetical protein [Phycisphaeraceae bacterium]